MSKAKILGIVVIILIALAAVGFWLFHKTPTQSNPPPQTQKQTLPDTPPITPRSYSASVTVKSVKGNSITVTYPVAQKDAQGYTTFVNQTKTVTVNANTVYYKVGVGGATTNAKLSDLVAGRKVILFTTDDLSVTNTSTATKIEITN